MPNPIRRLRAGRTPADRAAAALQLAETDSQEAVAALTEALSDPAVEVRANAAVTLASLRDPASIDALARVAAAWAEPSLARGRRAALATLTAFRSERAAVALGRALVDARPRAQLSIEDRSTLLGVAYAEPTGIAAARVVRTLAGILESNDDPAADRAGGLLELFPVESLGPLVRTLRTARVPAARRRAATSLRVCRHDDAVAALVVGLTDPTAEVRSAAARSLGEIRDPVALEPLSAAATDPDPAVRRAARSAAAALGVVARAAGVAAALAQREQSSGA